MGQRVCNNSSKQIQGAALQRQDRAAQCPGAIVWKSEGSIAKLHDIKVKKGEGQ